jgi:hypothetical protein
MSEESPSFDVKDKTILDLMCESGVTVRPSVTRLVRGNGNAAMVFCQVLWFSGLQSDPREWFEYSNAQIGRATGLGKRAIATAFEFLLKLELVEVDERAGETRRLKVKHRTLLHLLYRLTNRKIAKLSGNEAGAHALPPPGAHALPPPGAHALPVSSIENIRTLDQPPVTEKQSRKGAGSKRGTSLPTSRIETSILCPADLSLTPALEAWAEKRLPPTTLARMPGLIEYFVRDHREVQQTRLRDRKAWEARFQNFLQSCGERDGQRRGSGSAPAEDSSPSYDTLVKAGILGPELPTAPMPAQASPGVYVPGDKCSF